MFWPFPIPLERGFQMLHRFRDSLIILMSALILSSAATAQNERPQQSTAAKEQKATSVADQKTAPAPRHDISGTWEPANGPSDGIQADAVLPGEFNDPRDKCEPMGFPRMNFYNLRETQILQNEYKVAMLYEYATTWRVIWTDGRELPKLVDGGVMIGKETKEPRYYGYSVGKWVDDTTLVIQTTGMMGEERVWLDTAGRPISDRLRVEERLHRVDHDHLEWTVTIDDPKMYTKPWIAMNKFPMKLENPHKDVMEQYCSPSEMERYNKIFGDPSSGAGKH
jgi:hypothetical protein